MGPPFVIRKVIGQTQKNESSPAFRSYKNSQAEAVTRVYSNILEKPLKARLLRILEWRGN